MRIAVVGASGFVGRAVAQLAESQGHEVVRVRAPRLTTTYRTARELLAEAEKRVSSNPREIEDVAGAQVVINAAGLAEPGRPLDDALVGANALMPCVLSLLCARYGVRRFIHVSSAAVYGYGPLDEDSEPHPESAYGLSKLLGDRLIQKTAGIEAIAYRPTSVQGPDRTITRTLTRFAHSPLSSVAGAGNAHTPQISVTAVAAAALFLAECDQVPNAPVIHPATDITTAGLLRGLSGREPFHVPEPLAKLVLRVGRKVAPLDGKLTANVRRLELVWFGQKQSNAGWLSRAGFTGASMFSDPSVENASKRILYATTIGTGINGYLRGQLSWMRERGWDVHVASADDHYLQIASEREKVTRHGVGMVRKLSVLGDLQALAKWVDLITRLRPSVTNVSTPKAGLYGGIAAWICRVPKRVYLVRGLRLEGARGPMQAFLWMVERLSILVATDTVAVSHSIAKELLRRQLVPRKRTILVIGEGSSNGIAAAHVRAATAGDTPTIVRHELGIPADQPVIGFVGRLAKDKGLDTLAHAMSSPELQRAVCICVGNAEDSHLLDLLESHCQRFIHVPHVADPWRYFAAIDILCLPSRREGFPNVVLEAACAGAPTVATRATGTVDAIRDGETGFLVAQGDAATLAKRLAELINDEGLRKRLGSAAKARAESAFDQRKIWSAYEEIYRGNLLPYVTSYHPSMDRRGV